MGTTVVSLKQLIKTKCAVGIGARDALDAALIQSTGFDFVWASSFCISAAHCVLDASILSMIEFLDAARSMSESTSIPVLLDADTGYGGPPQVRRAGQLCERAGLTGMCLEDGVFPCGYTDPNNCEVLPVSDFVKKIRAVVQARRSDDFLIMARTEAVTPGSNRDEALERALAYEAAGADCVLVHSREPDAGALLNFIAEWRGQIPLAIVPTRYPTLTLDTVERLSCVKIVIYGNHALRGAFQAMRDILEEIRRVGGIHTINQRIAPLGDLIALQSRYS